MDPNNDGLPQSFEEFTARVWAYTAQFPTNFQKAFKNTSMTEYIRLVWIVGAYILLRPFIEKMFQKWMRPDKRSLREIAEDAKARDDAEAEEQAELEGKIDPETGLPRHFGIVKAGDIRGNNAGEDKKPEISISQKQGKSTVIPTKKQGGKAITSATPAAGTTTRNRKTKSVAVNPTESITIALDDEDDDDEVPEGVDPVLLKGWDY